MENVAESNNSVSSAASRKRRIAGTLSMRGMIKPLGKINKKKKEAYDRYGIGNGLVPLNIPADLMKSSM